MSEKDFNPESLDLTNLREITGGDEELEQALFQAFITCGHESLDVLARIAADGEQKEWKEHSHSLKGEAANLGANKLRELCHNSQMAYTDTAVNKNELLVKINSEFAVVEAYLNELIQA